MDTATLAAGPELDRLVAEKVMGWGGRMTAGEATASMARNSVFCPSTNIAHAWEAVESLHPTMRHFSLFYCETQCEWLCRMDKIRCVEEAARFKAWADTAPLAICRAALAAVGA